MPKSKREQVVHLSSVKKRPTRAKNETLYARTREAADAYPFVYVLRVSNMRNALLQDVRRAFADSRIFFGKTKVMAKALCGGGASSSAAAESGSGGADDEYQPGMAGLKPYLSGDVGLLFSARLPSDVLAHFASYAPTAYARAGNPAASDFVLPAGALHSRGGAVPQSDDVPLPHSVETTIRKWGVPTRLHAGRVLLDSDYVVCRAGQTLDSNQTALLKFFGVTMTEFRVGIEAYWSAGEGKVTVTEGEVMQD